MTSTIEKTLKRFEEKFVGVNALSIDRLHKGTEAEVDFYVKLCRYWWEMQDALDIAATAMLNMDEEIVALRESVKASGEISMGLGDKRKDAE